VDVERWGWYSIGINVVLAAINLVIAQASGSLAVAAEMLHNVVDLLTAIAVLVGLKLATRKTKRFPYGLYKLENVIAVGLAITVFLTAYEIGRDALFSPPVEATVNAWMLGGVVVATAIPLAFSRLEMRAGQAANSPALIADAKEYRAHVFTTGIVFVALLAQWLNFPIDRIAALVIVVAISKTGWDLLSDGMRVLLDASLDAETILTIREQMSAAPAVTEVKWVTGRNAGRYRFVEAEVALRVSDLKRAEMVLHEIEDRIRETVPYIDRVLIHAEPQARTHLWYAVPQADTSGTVDDHFGEAPYFALLWIRLSDGEIVSQELLRNPYREVSKAKGLRVAEWLIEHKVDVVLLHEGLASKGPSYAFGEAGVELHQIEAATLADVVTTLRPAPDASSGRPPTPV
jgi:cation diffusion facilitator family transporter